MALPKELLEVLACPLCKSDVKLTGDNKLACVSSECGLKYPIKDDIPVMLIEEADRSCPKCGRQREFSNSVLSCSSCGTSLEFKRLTPK